MPQVGRATRFPLVTRVLWRPRLQNEWSEAWSVNASRSGVLLRVAHAPQASPVALGREIDMIVGLSWEDFTIDSADIQCSGRVVRIEDREPSESLVAATIDYYRFLKPA
jgi:hypothetical protein